MSKVTKKSTSIYDLYLHDLYEYKNTVFDLRLMFSEQNKYNRNFSRKDIKDEKIISIIDLIKTNTSFLTTNAILERVYYIVYNIHDVVLCETCKNKKTKYGNGIIMRYCSSKCAVNSERYIENRKNTCIERYGVDNPWKSNVVQDKIKKTNIDRYGVVSPIQNSVIYNKIKNTCIEKYGVDNAAKSNIVKDKIKDTVFKRYNVESYFQSREFKEQSKSTSMKKYGVCHHSQSEYFKDKVKSTSIEKYGTFHPMQSDKVLENYRNAMYLKYGYFHTFDVPEIKEKIKNTKIMKYGEDHHMKSCDYFAQNSHKIYKHKTYTFSCGYQMLIQGYEDVALNFLESIGYGFDDVSFKVSIKYKFNNKEKVYHPDICIKKENRIIEVKSEYTWKADLEKNVAKLVESSKQYNVELWIIVKNKIHMFCIGDNFNVNDVVIKEDF